MIKTLANGLVFLAVIAIGFVAAAKEEHPMGLLAVSAGDNVVVADPSTGLTKAFPTGPVAWLFPAPGGILYAPDLMNGATTVINLRTQTVQDTLDGVTMPHFGDLIDRYLVVSRQMLVMSYPERAVMGRVEASFTHPWQVQILAGNTIALVLERRPEGGGDVWMTAVKLDEGRVVYRQALGGDVRQFALSENLGVLALADAENRQVLVVEPATLAPIASFKVESRPMDLSFALGGSMLVVAVARDDGGGELKIWKIKANKENTLELAKNWTLPLAGRPVRLVPSPDGRHVAVGSESQTLEVFDIDKREIISTAEIGDSPRDVVWCDPSTEGPSLPQWSNEKPPEMDFGAKR